MAEPLTRLFHPATAHGYHSLASPVKDVHFSTRDVIGGGDGCSRKWLNDGGIGSMGSHSVYRDFLHHEPRRFDNAGGSQEILARQPWLRLPHFAVNHLLLQREAQPSQFGGYQNKYSAINDDSPATTYSPNPRFLTLRPTLDWVTDHPGDFRLGSSRTERCTTTAASTAEIIHFGGYALRVRLYKGNYPSLRASKLLCSSYHRSTFQCSEELIRPSFSTAYQASKMTFESVKGDQDLAHRERVLFEHVEVVFGCVAARRYKSTANSAALLSWAREVLPILIEPNEKTRHALATAQAGASTTPSTSSKNPRSMTIGMPPLDEHDPFRRGRRHPVNSSTHLTR
ncbi:hypothetical protein ONZ45_g8549 [Pleurotus djamor]|nr:hypothetical protein ONZ45_g8549 [Pleurotus djamor]